MDKPIDGYTLLENIHDTPLVFVAEKVKPFTRFIEYSAYEELENKYKLICTELIEKEEECDDYEAKLSIAVEALEWADEYTEACGMGTVIIKEALIKTQGEDK